MLGLIRLVIGLVLKQKNTKPILNRDLLVLVRSSNFRGLGFRTFGLGRNRFTYLNCVELGLGVNFV